MTYLHIDLYAGLGGWQTPFKESDKWRSVGVEIDLSKNPDVVGDVRHLPIDASPTLLTMSPPCPEFTKWYLPWFWGGSMQGEPSMELVHAALDAVEALEPEWWIMENVKGLNFYWKPSRKQIGPYYLWGEFPPFDAETTWKHQNQKPKDVRREESAKIPYHIADALRRSVEVWEG